MKLEFNYLNRLAVCLVLVAVAGSTFAQDEKKAIRRGNNAFKDNDYVESEVQYRKALESNAHSIKGNYNLSTSLYKQEKYDDAVAVSKDINLSGLSEVQKAAVYHNTGNALYKQQKYKESAEAYKQALKLNPKDVETKYNMSEALRMLKQQQNQQNKDQDNKDQNNKDQNNKDQNNKDQDNKDQDNKDQDKDQDNKDQNQDKDKNLDKQNKDNQNQEQNNQQQPQISKEDAERMLEAIQSNEKDVQDKMKAQKAKAAKVKVLKNW